MLGSRYSLLPPTSLHVRRGELLLVTGGRQDHRTALALLLSGGMKPSGGLIGWDGGGRLMSRRLASTLLDSPGVNEPEQHLSVRDLVTEDLALIPAVYRGALMGGPWLKVKFRGHRGPLDRATGSCPTPGTPDRAGTGGSGTLADEITKGAGQVPNPDDAQKNNLSRVMADPLRSATSPRPRRSRTVRG